MDMGRVLLGKPPMCKLHRAPLVRGPVPIVHGRPGLSAEYLAAQRLGFPNAHSFAASCLTYQGQPESREVDFCPVCRSAEQAWQSSHASGQPSGG